MPRTLVLEGPRLLHLAEQPSRPLRPGEIRLRALLSGISHGTELSLYRGTSAFTDKVFDRGPCAFVHPPAGSAAAYPVTLGYERGPAGPPVPVRPGAGRLPLDRRAPPGRGQGRPHLPVTARAR